MQKRFKSQGLPLLDPVKDMKIKDPRFEALLKRVERLEAAVRRHPLHKSPSLPEQLALYRQRLQSDRRIGKLKTDIKNATRDVALRSTLKGMKRVLRRMGHTTADNVIDTKGRVSCEISTCDELLATELIFSGFFNALDPAHLVAVCSCLVFDEPSKENPALKEDLATPFRKLQVITH